MPMYHCRPIALTTALTYLSIYLATFACVFAGVRRRACVCVRGELRCELHQRC